MRTNNMTIDALPGLDEWSGSRPAIRVANRFTSIAIAANSSDTRAYFRRLRCAEMAAWEQSGGDYLLSRHAIRTSD